MAKLTLNTIGSRYGSIDALNANFDAIETALENTLSRDGTLPNNMDANLDMDSNRIINLTDALNNSDAVTLRQVNGLIAGASSGLVASLRENFVATAGQTVFNIASFTYNPGSNNLAVYLDGVRQYPGTSYTETDNNTITFSAGLHVGALVMVISNQSVDTANLNAALVHYNPAGTGAVATNVQSKLRETVSVKDFGATGNGTTDDSAAIQAALDSGNSCIYLPVGTYNILTTLNVPEGVSVIGAGAEAILTPKTVNCFLFLASNYIGNVQFSNFTVLGDTDNQYAFKYESLATSNRVTGVLFQNLTTGNIRPGYFNGLWYSTFRSCTFYGCYIGLQFVGQNVKCLVDDCRILKGGSSTGNSVGVNIDGAISPIVTGTYKRGEDIQITNTLIFGFDYAVNVVDVLYFSVTDCDLDYVQEIGVNITQGDAICDVIGNWIAIDAATTSPFRGVSFNALGTIRNSEVNISNNVMLGIGGLLQSEGVYVGGNQVGVVINSNELRGFKYGVSLNGGSDARVINNTFNNSVDHDVFMFSTSKNYFAGNNFSGDIYRHPTQDGPNQYASNNGYLTQSSGLLPVSAGALTATATLASLGLPSGDPSVTRVTYAVMCMPSADRGAIYASCDGTNVTFTAKTAVVAASSLAFTVQAIDN